MTTETEPGGGRPGRGGGPTVALLTREYPPEVYGGAGVHVEHLARALRPRVDLRVHCFGAPRAEPGTTAHPPPPGTGALDAALRTIAVDLAMAQAAGGADVLHSHTWYANLAGDLARRLHGVPHVVTTHSLEPLRPWKAEQLGGGYALSTFCERTGLLGADRVIAVSEGMRADLLRCYPELEPRRVEVVRSGIDTRVYHPDRGTDALEPYGLAPGPGGGSGGGSGGPPPRATVACVGRLTRQKGLAHLLRAAPLLADGTRLAVCTGQPDTPAIEREFAALAEEARAAGCDLVWVRDPLPLRALRQLLTLADVFVCPSVYEPLGLVNLEALACGTPVVATATGGIPEVVADGATGLLVPITPGADGSGDPAEPPVFAAALAERVNRLLADPAGARAMGEAGRAATVRDFTWDAVAERVLRIYESAIREARM